jgi:uncharacterized membrane protein
MLWFSRIKDDPKIRDTMRIEIWSDAVVAIIITLLVIELEVPELHDMSVRGVFLSLAQILPQIAAFTFSFLTLAVFWVPHFVPHYVGTSRVIRLGL